MLLERFAWAREGDGDVVLIPVRGWASASRGCCARCARTRRNCRQATSVGQQRKQITVLLDDVSAFTASK